MMNCENVLVSPSVCVCGLALQMMSVQVQATTGNIYNLRVAHSDSVDYLRRIIAKKTKLSKDRIILLHKDRQLRDGSMEENNIRDGAKLYLVPSVETGLLSQRPEQSVMQALESLNDGQVTDFLSGKAPLNLTMRLGDHMMLIQLQLSTVSPVPPHHASLTSNNTRSSSSSYHHHGGHHHNHHHHYHQYPPGLRRAASVGLHSGNNADAAVGPAAAAAVVASSLGSKAQHNNTNTAGAGNATATSATAVNTGLANIGSNGSITNTTTSTHNSSPSLSSVRNQVRHHHHHHHRNSGSSGRHHSNNHHSHHYHHSHPYYQPYHPYPPQQSQHNPSQPIINLQQNQQQQSPTALTTKSNSNGNSSSNNISVSTSNGARSQQQPTQQQQHPVYCTPPRRSSALFNYSPSSTISSTPSPTSSASSSPSSLSPLSPMTPWSASPSSATPSAHHHQLSTPTHHQFSTHSSAHHQLSLSGSGELPVRVCPHAVAAADDCLDDISGISTEDLSVSASCQQRSVGGRVRGVSGGVGLDTRALAEASRNLTQTLRQLSSEVLTSRPSAAAVAAAAQQHGSSAGHTMGINNSTINENANNSKNANNTANSNNESIAKDPINGNNATLNNRPAAHTGSSITPRSRVERYILNNHTTTSTSITNNNINSGITNRTNTVNSSSSTRSTGINSMINNNSSSGRSSTNNGNNISSGGGGLCNRPSVGMNATTPVAIEVGGGDSRRGSSCHPAPSQQQQPQGAIIESMQHHGKGVFSGTFSGTLNPALQDRQGRPKRDISTIIHILNDLLCATPHYTSTASAGASAPSPQPSPPPGHQQSDGTKTDSQDDVSAEDAATRSRVEQVQAQLKQRADRRKARRLARTAGHPYMPPNNSNNNNSSSGAANNKQKQSPSSVQEQQQKKVSMQEKEKDVVDAKVPSDVASSIQECLQLQKEQQKDKTVRQNTEESLKHRTQQHEHIIRMLKECSQVSKTSPPVQQKHDRPLVAMQQEHSYENEHTILQVENNFSTPEPMVEQEAPAPSVVVERHNEKIEEDNVIDVDMKTSAEIKQHDQEQREDSLKLAADPGSQQEQQQEQQQQQQDQQQQQQSKQQSEDSDQQDTAKIVPLNSGIVMA